MEILSAEAIVSLALTALSLLITFIGHYFYVRGKLHKAATGAIANAEQDDKTGEEKLEIAVEQVYELIPTMLKPFLHKRTVRKIVQAAFDHIEVYAKKQVEKKSKKKDTDCSGENDLSAADEKELGSSPNDHPSEVIVSEQDDDYTDSGGADGEWQDPNDIIQQHDPALAYAATEDNDQAPDAQSATQVNTSRACSTNNHSIREKIIMENNNINNVIDNANSNAINDETVTCYEDIGAGTDYSKQFTNPKTGLHTAVLFSSPIDNNDGIEAAAADDFIDAVNDDGEEVFESRRNKFLVRLAKSTAQNKLVELIQDDYKIAMSPVAAVTSKLNRFVGTIRRDIQAMRNLRRSPRSAASKVTELVHGAVKFALKDREPSDVRFANIISNCDLEYLVENNRLKENIIVNARSEAYEYLFKLDLGKLEARANGKTIELYDAATNEVKFLIPAPYMYDMANEQSDAVEYMLEGGAGNYTLRVIADEAWINADARQFPVVIDPQIMGNTTDIITMGEYKNGNVISPVGDKISLGCNYYNNQAHIFEMGVSIKADPIRKAIGTQTRVLHAILELTKADGGYQPSTSKGFSVKDGDRTIDQFTYNGINNRIDIDITSQIQDAITNNNNVQLRMHRNATDSTTDFIVFMTEKAYVSEYRPRIFIDYVSSRLESEGCARLDLSAGRAGSGSVDLNTSGVKWKHSDLTVRDGSLELPVSHIYNSDMAGKTTDGIMRGIDEKEIETDEFKCGKGFKLDIHQRLINKPAMGSAHLMGSENKVYIDGQGNHHDFVEKYYYKDPQYGYSHYVDRADCYMKPTGELTYDDNGTERDVIHEVSNELGMRLESYSRYVDYATSDKEYVSKYYYIMNGKRYYVERKGDIVYIPTYYYIYDAILLGNRDGTFYVPESNVKKVDGEYYTLNNIKLTRIIEQQRISSNTLYIKRSKVKMNHKPIIGHYHEVVHDNIECAVYEERKYDDDTVIDVFDFVNSEDINNLNEQIRSLVEYQHDVNEHIVYCSSKISEYQVQYSKQKEMNDVKDKIAKIQKQSLDYNAKKQEELYELQKKQLELQYKAQQANNKAYFFGSELDRIDQFYANQDYEATTGISLNSPYLDALKNKKKEGLYGFFEQLQVDGGQSDVSKMLDIPVDPNYIAYNDDGYLTAFSSFTLNRHQNAISNLKLVYDAKSLVAGQRTDYYDRLALNYNDQLSKLSMLEGERTQAIAIAELEDAIADDRAKMADVDRQIGALVLQRDLLIAEQKKQPTDFIITEDKNFLGFDYYGKLVVLSDLHENQISIIYDDEDNIKSLNDKDGNVLMQFVYSDGNIASMTDSQGRICRYEYKDGYLTKAVYPDGESSEFTYDESGRLVKVKGIADEAVRFAYADTVLTVTESVAAERVDKNGVTPCLEKLVKTCKITRTSDYTTTVETKDASTQYVFDRMGRAVTVYTKTGNAERNASYEYNGLNKSFSCGELMSEKNIVVNHDFSGGMIPWTHSSGDSASITAIDNRTALQLSGSEECYICQVINISDVDRKDIPNNGVMVLSAWAKAQSMSVRHNKRITAYGKDLFTEYEETSSNVADKLRNNRRFGLKAVVEYGGGIVSDTYECTYDFYNTDWQLAALPVKIKDVQKVSKITVFFDYSYNYGNAYVTDFKLCKCNGYTERTFDDDRNVISEFDGDILTEYEYVEDLPIKSIMTVDGKKYESKMRYDPSGALLYSCDHNGNCVENVYDDKGVLIQTAKYNENDSTSKYVEEYLYDKKGELIATLDPRGEVNGEVLKTEYEYSRGLTMSEKTTDRRKTVYGYDYDTDTQTGMSNDDDGEANGTTYKYTKDMLTTVSHNGIDINYAYDGRGRIMETEIAGKVMESTVYVDGITANDLDTATTAFADGTVLRSATDSKNRKKTVQDVTNGTTVDVLKYEYDGNTDKLKKVTDGIANIVYEYISDEKNPKTSYALHGESVVLSETYDDKGLLKISEVNINDVKEEYAYGYAQTPEHDLVDVMLPNDVKQTLERDALGRMYSVSQTVGNNTITDENRYYLKYGDRTTDYVSSVRFGINGSLDEQLKYKYDKAGNITEIYKNGLLTSRYTYDKLNRMVREDNKEMGKTTVFAYDAGGNILSKSEYGFTLSSLAEKTAVSVMLYSYKASGWRDQMTAYNGEKCVYDEMGRPTTYRNKTLAWNRYGTLASYNGNTYTYDANGIRLTKTVNGVTTKFFISGTKILGMEVGTNKLRFRYGVNGIQGFGYNGQEYIYRKNVQGDITRVYKLTNGVLELAAEYKYDAWGKCEVTDIDNSGIGNINPIRYRGYYYDTDTGLYYLNARYYDPETGRFISADSTQYLEPNTINGLNLYAYCGNNPVMGYDPYGTWDWGKFWKSVGMIFTAVAAVVISVTTFGAGTPLAMTLVAGVTLTAGILTGVNGIATMIEAGTGYNFVRDGIFQGNETAYNWYAGITEGIAVVGTAILGVYHTTGRYNASKYGQKLLGKGYKKVSKGRWVSADGTRQLRWDTSHHMIDGVKSKNHFNFDFFIKAPIKGNDTLGKIHIILSRFGFTTTGWTIF